MFIKTKLDIPNLFKIVIHGIYENHYRHSTALCWSSTEVILSLISANPPSQLNLNFLSDAAVFGCFGYLFKRETPHSPKLPFSNA